MAQMDVWESRHISYVLDFYLAKIYGYVYLHLRAGFHVDGED